MLLALPVPAGIEEDWQNQCTKGQHAIAAKDLATAEAAYTKALELAEHFGSTAQHVAFTAQALGNVLRGLRKLPEAEAMEKRAASIYEATPGANSMEFAQAEFDLATVLLEAGRYDQALAALNRLLPTFDLQLGPHDLKTAAALCMQGDVFRMQKRYASAETALKRCADMRADDGGVSTAEFGDAANSLAMVYQHLNKYQEADRFFNLAGKVRESTVGLLSPEMAETLEAHAVLLRQLGRKSEAQEKETLAAKIRAHTGKK